MRCTTTAIAGSSVEPALPGSDDPLAVQRRPAVDEPLDERDVTDHVGEGLVHPGERGARGVLGGRRRPHRHRRAAPSSWYAASTSSARASGRRPCARGAQPLRQFRRGRRIVDLRRGASANSLTKLVAHAALVHRLQVAGGGDHEPGRTGEPARASSPRLAPLPPDRRDVGHAELVEPDDRRRPSATAASVAWTRSRTRGTPPRPGGRTRWPCRRPSAAPPPAARPPRRVAPARPPPWRDRRCSRRSA